MREISFFFLDGIPKIDNLETRENFEDDSKTVIPLWHLDLLLLVDI